MLLKYFLNCPFLDISNLLMMFFSKGVSTAREVYEVLSHRGWQELFPLFTTVHEIAVCRLPPTAIVEYSEHKPKFSLVEGSDKYY